MFVLLKDNDMVIVSAGGNGSGGSGSCGDRPVPSDFSRQSLYLAHQACDQLQDQQRASLERQNLNANDWYSTITTGETMTDNAVRAAMRLIDAANEDFTIYTDSLALQQIGNLPTCFTYRW